MRTSNTPKMLLFAYASALFATALAQNYSCPGNILRMGNVNSTGQHQFTWNSSYATDDPWYVSVVVGSQGAEWDDVHDVRGLTYISVPGNVSNDTEICIYQYTNINETLQATAENSCNGVLSSECIDQMTDALGEATGSGCPSLLGTPESDAFNKACPMLSGNAARSIMPLDVTNDTCIYTDLPEVQVPDGYNTYGTLMGLEAFKSIRVSADANQAYDILTRQTIPLVLLGSFIDPKSNRVQHKVEFVCMNANKTVEGSRVPEKEKPWESAGARECSRMVGLAVAVVTAAVLVL